MLNVFQTKMAEDSAIVLKTMEAAFFEKERSDFSAGHNLHTAPSADQLGVSLAFNNNKKMSNKKKAGKPDRRKCYCRDEVGHIAKFCPKKVNHPRGDLDSELGHTCALPIIAPVANNSHEIVWVINSGEHRQWCGVHK